jgi:cyclic-di-GMP phosphodiesterase, flagellum assembly factor TipF
MMHHRRGKANQLNYQCNVTQKTIGEAGSMGLRSIGIIGASALVGGAAGAGVFAVTGAGIAASGLGGLAFAGCAAALAQLHAYRSERGELREAYNALLDDVTSVIERQAQTDAKLAEIERRTIESPALVWRAAAADIEVLSSLVSDLARNVADHDRRLAEKPAEPPQAAAATVQPAPSPDWFEDEAELGFTADAAPVEETFTPPSPAVIAELKTTLATALASDRLELLLQPIVTLPQRKTFGYEASLRLKGGGSDFQSSADLRRIAVATDLEPELDRVLVERAVQVLRILRARNREIGIVCAVSAKSLDQPKLRAVIESLVRGDAALAGAITLEIGDADVRSADAATRAALQSLAAIGVGIGLSRLPHLRLDLSELSTLGVRQVRVPAQTMLQSAQEAAPRSDIHPADLAELLGRRGIELLVSDITSEQSVLDLLDYAAPLATGPLFGAARPVRPEVLEPKAVGGEKRATARKPLEAPPAEASGKALASGQRQSFRSLLRRA